MDKLFLTAILITLALIIISCFAFFGIARESNRCQSVGGKIVQTNSGIVCMDAKFFK